LALFLIKPFTRTLIILNQSKPKTLTLMSGFFLIDE
jgi:hypothetical protein